MEGGVEPERDKEPRNLERLPPGQLSKKMAPSAVSLHFLHPPKLQPTQVFIVMSLKMLRKIANF